jgi:FKBP-type peptidyl-prolyl cis-trans isomerase FklB
MGETRVARTAVGVALAVLAASSAAAEPLDLEDETTRINYSVGYQIGGDFKRQGVALDAEAVVRGIEDALAGASRRSPA